MPVAAEPSAQASRWRNAVLRYSTPTPDTSRRQVQALSVPRADDDRVRGAIQHQEATDLHIAATALPNEPSPTVSITIRNMPPGTAYDLVLVAPTGEEIVYPRELIGTPEGTFHLNYSFRPDDPEGEYRIELRPEGSDDVLASARFTVKH